VAQPWREAIATQQLTLFEQQNTRQDDFRNRLVWGDNKLVMASLLQEFKGKVDLIFDTPTIKRRGILGSTKPLKLDSLRRLAQRWDSPQALLSECPSVVAFLQVLFGLKQYASKTDSSSSCESFTCCQEEARTMQQNRIDSIVKVQHVFRQQGFLSG